MGACRPWVLSDYTSASLDLSSPCTFRTLWKPVGALDEKRLAAAQLQRRELADAQREIEGDDEGDKPLYHTHYSSPAYVAYYLLRVYPELTIHIQSGQFDQSSRTFTSVAETWQNVSQRATGDVKELIPQFYSDPAFLTNELGIAPSQDVVLPPWAHGSADEFVRGMRAALESEYVSAHLHLWIDLIFGYKQAGAVALAANNLFPSYTYESALQHAENIELVLTYASEIGQTPPQLFAHPHPPRRLRMQPNRSWRAVEPAATVIQAGARRLLTQRHVEERAVTFFFEQVAFRTAEPPSTSAAPVDLLWRTSCGLEFACCSRWAHPALTTQSPASAGAHAFSLTPAHMALPAAPGPPPIG